MFAYFCVALFMHVCAFHKCVLTFNHTTRLTLSTFSRLDCFQCTHLCVLHLCVLTCTIQLSLFHACLLPCLFVFARAQRLRRLERLAVSARSTSVKQHQDSTAPRKFTTHLYSLVVIRSRWHMSSLVGSAVIFCGFRLKSH